MPVPRTSGQGNSALTSFSERGVLTSLFQELKVAELTRLVGEIITGIVVNPNQWITTTTGSGTVTAASGIVTVRTGITAGSTASLESLRRAKFLSGTSNVYLGGIRLPEAGAANNKRRWGAYDGSDGVGFLLDGTTFKLFTRNAGIDTEVTVLNGPDTFNVDTNFHVYEIMFVEGAAQYFVDQKLIHTETKTSANLGSTPHFKIRMETVNSGGGTADVSVIASGVSICRFGKERSRPEFLNIVANGVTTLKSSPGTLLRIVINKKGTGSNQVVIYDNIAASGAKIGTIDTPNVPGGHFEYDLDFNTGLTIDMNSGGAADITVIYD